MDLARAWRRAVLGAAGGAMLAPAVVLVAALVVGIGGGGLGGLPSLRQLITGPTASALETAAAASNRETSEDAGGLLEDTIEPPRAPGPGTTVPGAGAPGEPRRGSDPRRTRRPSPAGPGATPTPGGTATPQPPPSGSPQPTPTPTPTPGPVRQVGDTVKSVTRDVPVVGPTAGEVIDLVVDTAEEVIPPLP